MALYKGENQPSSDALAIHFLNKANPLAYNLIEEKIRKCENCHFYQCPTSTAQETPPWGIIGSCHLIPQPINKKPQEWCGKFERSYKKNFLINFYKNRLKEIINNRVLRYKRYIEKIYSTSSVPPLIDDDPVALGMLAILEREVIDFINQDWVAAIGEEEKKRKFEPGDTKSFPS